MNWRRRHQGQMGSGSVSVNVSVVGWDIFVITLVEVFMNM